MYGGDAQAILGIDELQLALWTTVSNYWHFVLRFPLALGQEGRLTDRKRRWPGVERVVRRTESMGDEEEDEEEGDEEGDDEEGEEEEGGGGGGGGRDKEREEGEEEEEEEEEMAITSPTVRAAKKLCLSC
jgi:hypothetical protein